MSKLYEGYEELQGRDFELFKMPENIIQIKTDSLRQHRTTPVRCCLKGITTFPYSIQQTEKCQRKAVKAMSGIFV